MAGPIGTGYRKTENRFKAFAHFRMSGALRAEKSLQRFCEKRTAENLTADNGAPTGSSTSNRLGGSRNA